MIQVATHHHLAAVDKSQATTLQLCNTANYCTKQHKLHM